MTVSPTDTPNQTESLTDEIFARCTSDQKAKLDLLGDYYESSNAGVVRHLIDEAFHDRFDSIDPELAHESDLSTSEILDLVQNDNIDEDSVHAELQRATNEDETSDDTPRNYSTTLVPAELERSGPELDWDELREAVQNPEDGGFWSDDLEIHPDRLGDNTLRANHRAAGRILASVARAYSRKKYNGEGIIREDDLEDLVDTYCLHLTTRFDRESGKEYVRETYLNLLKQHLWSHPKPEKGLYYLSEDRYEFAVSSFVSDIKTLLGPERWTRDDDQTDRDLAIDNFRTIAMARRVANEFSEDTLANADDDLADAAEDEAATLPLFKLAKDTERDMANQADHDFLRDVIKNDLDVDTAEDLSQEFLEQIIDATLKDFYQAEELLERLGVK